MKRLIIVVMLGIALGISTFAQAELINRGGGMIYDTDLNITWLDQSQQVTTWAEAKTWADNLTIGGYQDWRLPSGSGWGYNQTGSEIGYLFYVELGNNGYVAPNGSYNNPYGLLNSGPFENLLAEIYWSGTQYSGTQNGCNQDGIVCISTFNFYTGGLYYNTDDSTLYVMAVHSGDVVPVPAPASLLLLGSGFAGIVALKRKMLDKIISSYLQNEVKSPPVRTKKF